MNKTQYSTPLEACTIHLQLNGNFTASFSQLQFIPHQQTVSRQLTHQTLNTLLENGYNESQASLIDIPLHVETTLGSVLVNLSYSTQTKLVDRILSPVHTRWLPKQTVVFETQHWRGDAHSLQWDAPDLSSIRFTLSSSNSYDGRLAEVEAYNLQSAPQFRQLSGVGLASLVENQSSVQCTMNTCSVTWAFTSHWLMDDVDDLHILAKGIDIDDLKFVLNYDIPNEPETYVHRIGRCGRVGKEGVITVEEGQSLDNELDVVEGMQFDRAVSYTHLTLPTNREV